MQPGNRFVNIFHSAAVFFDPLAGDDATLKTVAFIGDRLPGQGCIPVALKPEKPWSWPGINMGTDEADFAAFHAEPSSQVKWYHPEGLRQTKQVPTALLLPTLLANFVITKPRMPWEVYKEAQRLETSGEYPITAEDTELVKAWAMGAAHSTDGAKSVLSMDIEPILSFDPTFQDWAKARLDSTLGTQHHSFPQARDASPGDSTDRRAADGIALQTAETLKAVVEALNVAKQSAGGGASSAITNTTKYIYSEYELAALQGFCGVTEPRLLPKLWLTFQTARKPEEVRANLREDMLCSKEQL
jgi:hypothetical protein